MQQGLFFLSYIRETNKLYYGKKSTKFQEVITMMEMAIFAVTFVVAQLVAGLILFKLLTSEKFIKKYVKLSAKVAKEVAEEMEDELYDWKDPSGSFLFAVRDAYKVYYEKEIVNSTRG